MKLITISIVLLFISTFTLSAQNTKVVYDSAYAKSLGADEYGMKNYIFVLLKKGDSVITDKKVRDSLFMGHMANIQHMADLGKLAVAGPFDKNDIDWRGIFILNTTDMEEARVLLSADPTISNHLFTPILVPWYGSAALMEISRIHKEIQKHGF